MKPGQNFWAASIASSIEDGFAALTFRQDTPDFTIFSIEYRPLASTTLNLARCRCRTGCGSRRQSGKEARRLLTFAISADALSKRSPMSNLQHLRMVETSSAGHQGGRLLRSSSFPLTIFCSMIPLA